MNWRTERAYYDRNRLTPEQLDRRYEAQVGHRKLAIWRFLLARIPRTARVLEVGIGEGGQVPFLRALGFDSVMGCDINRAALARCPVPSAAADMYRLPFRDRSFDLVLTSGVLIYVPARRLPDVAGELARVSARWLAGYEYWSAERHEIPWHGHRDYMWKDDFPSKMRRLTGFVVARLWYLPHIDGSGSTDCAYLLQRSKGDG